MACQCNNLAKNAICAAARQLLRQRFAELVQSIPCTHSNSDACFSPAEYWYDKAKSQRCTVSTSMGMGLRGNTIVIILSYA